MSHVECIVDFISIPLAVVSVFIAAPSVEHSGKRYLRTGSEGAVIIYAVY